MKKIKIKKTKVKGPICKEIHPSNKVGFVVPKIKLR